MEGGACGRLHPSACSVETLAGDDTDILAGWPCPARALAYVVAALCVSGIAPTALAELAIWAIDTLSCAWVLPVGVVAACVYGYRRCGI